MRKVFLALLIASLTALAQTSSLSGTVTDPSGAVVPEAIITITNVATSAARTVVSDGSGAYSAPQLPPGDYMIEAQRPGFSTYRTAEAVRLQINTPAELVVKMALDRKSTRLNSSH